MRLIHVTTVPFTLQFLRGQVGYMKDRGFEVHAISSPGPLLDSFARREEVPVHAVPMERRITPIADVRSLLALYRLMRTLRPEIVHAHTPKAGLLGMLAARLACVPVRIYQIHGLPLMTALRWKRWVFRRCDRTACRLADRVYGVSRSICQAVLEERLCHPKKIGVLKNGSVNGVDAQGRFNPANVSAHVKTAVRDRYRIPRDATVLGFVGRIVRDKGVLELVEAWELLRDEFPRLQLMMVGPFESRNAIAPELQTLIHADPRIHTTGFVEDTQRFYATMDLLLFPSHREGFGVSAIEANAMELPVVATRIPGCMDAVADGESGALVPAHNARALAEATRRYLLDPELRKQHGLSGRKRVLRDFRPQDIWEALAREYDQMLLAAGLPAVQPTAHAVSLRKAA